MTRPEAALIDELEFLSYVHNRKQFPDVEPGRWALIFSNVPEMEERYLDMLSTGNILDVADRAAGNAPVTDGLQVGDEGVSGTVEGHGMAATVVAEADLHDRCLQGRKSASVSEYQASPADSRTSTPLYLNCGRSNERI